MMRRTTAALAGLVLMLAGLCSSASAANVTYSYDSLGRLIQITYENGTTITYVYDAAGNRTSQTVTCSANPC